MQARLCVPITALSQIQEAKRWADILEFRLDAPGLSDVAELEQSISSLSTPSIFTLRSSKEGGFSILPPKKRVLELKKYLTLVPEYFDVELQDAVHLPELRKMCSSKTKFILSNHDFQKTTNNL